MRALVFDTETTSLIDNHLIPLDKQPEIIEWYAQVVDLATGEVQLVQHHLFKPRAPLSEEVKKITGITDDMLAQALPFTLVAPEINAFIGGVQYAIAHNFSYDKEMLDLEFERLGQKVNWPPVQICTVEATVHFRGYRLSLTGLHEHLFGEPMKEAHRAEADVAALTRCAIELFKRGDI